MATLQPCFDALVDLKDAYAGLARDMTSDSHVQCAAAFRRFAGLSESIDIVKMLNDRITRAQAVLGSGPEGPLRALASADAEDVSIEAELARKFGYSPKAARAYHREAKHALSEGLDTETTVADAASVLRAFKHSHSHAIELIGQQRNRRFVGRLAARKGLREANRLLFGTGVLMADCAEETTFEISYSMYLGLRLKPN